MDKNEVMENAVKYFNDDLAANVWWDKYCLKGIETNPSDTIVRIALELCRVELKYPNPISFEDIYKLLSGYKKFILAGSPLFGIGNDTTLSTLGNCFVIQSPEDSYGGIFRADQELAQIFKRRGGCGLDISSLRPKRAIVNNAANTSTGAISFMHRFSNTTREVAQEGRRGALILTMDISHPDSEEFIMSKDDLTKITGANISMKITDEFMTAVEENDDFNLSFKINKIDNPEYILIKVRARSLWDKLIHQAWKNGEPGVIFIDRIIENSPADCYHGFETQTVNPCGELPLNPYGICMLSAVNLYEYVTEPFTEHAYFEFDLLANDVMIMQRMMDNIVDLESEKILRIIDKIIHDPEDISIKKVELDLWNKIHRKLITGRRTGLGQMGLADAGAALGLKYGTTLFNGFAELVNKTIAINSYMSSIDMAEERGHFSDWNIDKEQNNPYIKRILEKLDVKYMGKYFKHGRRNIANLTIAPTGSISILSGCSSGIEPVFALSYKRKRKVTEDNINKSFKDKQGDWWEEYIIVHPKYELWLKEWEHNTANGIKLEDPYNKSTAHDIDPYAKLELQSKIQPWIDHSISVTYNLPETTTEETVSNLYFEAWKKGLKGLTVYREGSRDGVLKTHENAFKQHNAPKRPKILPHDVYSIISKGHHWMISVGVLEGKPYEVFAFNNVEITGTKFVGEMAKLAKGRYDLFIPSEDRTFPNITNDCSDEENLLTRMISTSLRHGADIKFVVEQLNKSEGDITSFGKGIGRVLKRYIPEGTKSSSLCPDCGSILIYEGGCSVCRECGNTKCG